MEKHATRLALFKEERKSSLWEGKVRREPCRVDERRDYCNLMSFVLLGEWRVRVYYK